MTALLHFFLFRENYEQSVALEKTSKEFGTQPSTILAWLRTFKKRGNLERKVGSGRNDTLRQMAHERLVKIFHEHGPQRTTDALVDLTVKVMKDGKEFPIPSRSTFIRALQSEQWKKVTPAIVPYLKSSTMEERLLWCTANVKNSFGGPKSSELYIECDEKYFYHLEYDDSSFMCPADAVDDFKFLTRTHKKNPTKKTHVMFFGAVARPRRDDNFDGRIGMWPVVDETATQQKNSKFGKKGDLTFPTIMMNKLVFFRMVEKKLIPAALRIVESKISSVKTIVVQLDFAGGHGGGKGNKRLLEEELNALGKRVLDQRSTDPSVFNQDHLDIYFKVQPSSSPDLNVLDLGIWTSLAKGVRSSSVAHGSRIDRKMLMDEVQKRFWETWDSVSSLHNIYGTKKKIIETIIETGGGNHYKIPHINGPKKERREPVPVTKEWENQQKDRFLNFGDRLEGEADLDEESDV